MPYYDSLKDKRVLMIYHPNFPLKDDNVFMGFYLEHLNGAVSLNIKEVDELGIWVENSELELEDASSGNIKKYNSLVLIKWEFILSIVRIPEEEVPKTKNEFGFSSKKSTS